METGAARQNQEERDLSALERGSVVIFVSDLEDVDDEDPVSALTAEVSSAIFPEFRKGDVLEYEDAFNWLKVKVVEVCFDDVMMRYKLKVLKVIAESSFKKKREVFIHEYAKGFGGRHLKRFGDEF